MDYLDNVGVTSLGSLDEHSRVILQFVVGVRPLLEQDLHHIEMTPGTGQAQGGVVIVGRLLAHVRPPGDEELEAEKYLTKCPQKHLAFHTWTVQR